MNNARQETVADIVREMRIGDLCAEDTSAARPAYINDFLASYADRIEAAAKECGNIKKVSSCYADNIVLSISNKNTILNYAFRTMKDAKEVLNILSDYTGIPITTTDNLNCRVGERIELIVYPF